MELAKAIRTRRAVRSYAATPLEKDTILRLLDAAVLAPSASNGQPWAFGVVEGAGRLKEYSDRAKAILLEQMEDNPGLARYRRPLSDPGFDIFYGAPALICIYAKPGTWPYPKIDCALAAQNLMLTAHDLGLGTCWIGFAQWLFDSPELKRELRIPLSYEAVGQLVVGYPRDGLRMPTPREKPEIAFWV